MTKANKIDILAFANFQAIVGAWIGLILGIIYSFGGFAIDLATTLGLMVTTETPGLSIGTVLAFGALIGMPLLFALMGFILGLIEALLYNTLIGKAMKIKLNFER